MENKEKTILVTGSAGAIGTRLCERLLMLGHKVIGVDNYITGRFENTSMLYEKFPESFTFFRQNANDIRNIIFETEPDEIYHAASPSSSQKYEMFPFDCIDVNSQAVDHILWAIKNHVPKCKFMFLSAAEVYGNPDQFPQNEKYRGNVTCIGPRGIYDNSKRLGETITSEHQRRFGTNTKIARIFKTASPYTDPNESNLINNFVRQALAGVPFTINGTGEQIRSICHVDDLIDSMMALMETSYHKPVNLGSDEQMSVLEIAKAVHETVHPELSPESIEFMFLPSQKDDSVVVSPDLSLARSLFDIKNKYGIRETIKSVADAMVDSIEDIKQ